MFTYCHEAVGIPVDDFKFFTVGFGCLVAGRQGRVGRRSPEKAEEQLGFEMDQVRFEIMT